MRFKSPKSLLLLLSTCAVLIIAFLPAREPTAKGRAISFWFEQLPLIFVPTPGRVIMASGMDSNGRKYGSASESSENIRESLMAIRSMGLQGLPFLFEKLEGRESVIGTWIRKAGVRCGVGRFVPVPSREIERAQAVTALVSFDVLPLDWTERLQKLSTNMNRGIAISAGYVLQHTNRSLQVPGYIAEVRDERNMVQPAGRDEPPPR